jgi:hypothetical protein
MENLALLFIASLIPAGLNGIAHLLGQRPNARLIGAPWTYVAGVMLVLAGYPVLWLLRTITHAAPAADWYWMLAALWMFVPAGIVVWKLYDQEGAETRRLAEIEAAVDARITAGRRDHADRCA